MDKKWSRILARVLFYLVGLMVLALGIAMATSSDLGISPTSSLPYVVSLILGFSQGNCTIIVYLALILVQMFLLGRFRPVLLLQLVFSTFFGYFVDAAKFILGDFMLPGYVGKLGMLAISIVLLALGLVLYVDAGLTSMPPDGLVGCICRKTGKAYPQVKTYVDCGCVVASVVLSLVFLGRLEGVREGTVITALVLGKVIGFLRKYIGPVQKRLCFGREETVSL